MFIITLILLSIASFGLMVFFILNRLDYVRAMPEEEFSSRLKSSQPVFTDVYFYIALPASNFFRTFVLPKIYKEFEKTISRFRINVLKIESLLLRLTNYIRGKRKVCDNGDSSKYWKDMNKFKDELNNGLNKDNKEN
jgi:hypothetical protein